MRSRRRRGRARRRGRSGRCRRSAHRLRRQGSAWKTCRKSRSRRTRPPPSSPIAGSADLRRGAGTSRGTRGWSPPAGS
ncbi:hypothetical protein DC434_16575 [Microbacterium sp. TPD7012]|nr:hypothetical protein DC434_16575 [Microbacterium sp. TPD7012]